MLKKDKKKDQKTLDLNMGVVAPVKSAPTGSQAANTSSQQQEAVVKEGSGVLEEELTFIRRQTIAVKATNVQAAFVQNLSSIQESVDAFKKMKEDSGNDIIQQFQSQKEQYESQIEKLAARLEKQTKQRDELVKLASTLKEEVEQLEYERT